MVLLPEIQCNDYEDALCSCELGVGNQYYGQDDTPESPVETESEPVIYSFRDAPIESLLLPTKSVVHYSSNVIDTRSGAYKLDYVDNDLDETGSQSKSKPRTLVPHDPCYDKATLRYILQFIGAFLFWLYILHGMAPAVVLKVRLGTTRPTTRWRLLNRNRAARLLHRIETRWERHSQPMPGVTLLLRGNRMDLMHQALASLEYCVPIVHVYIDWTDTLDNFPDTLRLHGKKVAIVEASKSKISTDAVFLLDEHVRLTCHDLEIAYNEWKLNPFRIVGFSPSDRPDESNHYALVSDEAAVVHRYYWSGFRSRSTNSNTEGGRNVDHDTDSCGHLVLSAYMARVTNESPVVLASTQTAKSWSTLGGKVYDDTCLARLSNEAGVSLPTDGTRFMGRRF